MYRLAMIIDESVAAGGQPSLVKAVNVEYNDVADPPVWDDASGTDFIATRDTETSTGSELWWWYVDIDVTGNYSIERDGDRIPGYDGKFIDVGDTVIAVSSNTAHRSVVTGNPHVVTKTDLSLENVSNLSPANQVSTGLTLVSQIVATGVDLSDIDVNGLYALSTELEAEKTRISALETTTASLTIANLLTAIAASDSTLDALASVLGASNLLADKVAQAMAE